MVKRSQILERFRKYDEATTERMTELIEQGRDIRRPVKTVYPKRRADIIDKAKFNSRKAAQVLKLRQPLKDDKGLPTPAAMQFARWRQKPGIIPNIPENYSDVREILIRAKKRLKRYNS